MAPLKRNRGKQSAEEREEVRQHLQDLETLREERLAALGSLAVEMHRRGPVDPDALFKPAAKIVAIEEEVKLVRRGLDEGLSLKQLQELARR